MTRNGKVLPLQEGRHTRYFPRNDNEHNLDKNLRNGDNVKRTESRRVLQVKVLGPWGCFAILYLRLDICTGLQENDESDLRLPVTSLRPGARQYCTSNKDGLQKIPTK